MSEDNRQRQEFIIDTEKLDDNSTGAVNYAMRVRDHIQAGRAATADAIGEKHIHPSTGQAICIILDMIDRNVMRDVLHIGGITLPDGADVLEAFDVTHDPRKAS